jgi:antitoxin ParD1/3/4
MNVSLTPALEKLVQTKVKTGRYTSASEVVREALRLMEQRDKAMSRHDQAVSPSAASGSMTDAQHLSALRHRLDSSLAQAARGESADGETFMRSLLNGLAPAAPRRRKKAS